MRELTDEEMEVLKSYIWADSGGGDATSPIFSDEMGTASIFVEDDCVLSGIEPALFLFEEAECDPAVMQGVEDGSVCGGGSEIMRVEGPVKDLLRAERIVLNILSRMSAIATISRNAADRAEAASPDTRVAGTRKTTPGFALMEKRALIDGGALPHRKDLTSMAMLKDNHLAALGGGPDAVIVGVEMIRDEYGPYMQVEVEVEDVSAGIAAVDAGADIILLDNMSPQQIEKASGEIREHAQNTGREIILEASGGIGPDDVEEYAPFVDVISMGSLTYGAVPVGFRMDLGQSED